MQAKTIWNESVDCILIITINKYISEKESIYFPTLHTVCGDPIHHFFFQGYEESIRPSVDETMVDTG